MALVALALGQGIPDGLLVRGDSPELTLVALSQGVAHAPGYPLWTRLAGLWLAVVGGEPGGSLSWMGLALMVATVGLLVGLLVRRGARPVVAAGVAACWALLPPHWGAVLAPEVYALELLLWVGALAALQSPRRLGPWLAGGLAVLAAAHRPIGLALLGAGALVTQRKDRRAHIGGAVLGGLLALALYVDLGLRAVAPETAWVDAVIQQDPVGWIRGAGFSDGRLGLGGLGGWLRSWGLQGALWCLGVVGLVWAPGARWRGKDTRALAGAAVALGVWSAVWVVPDPETTALPLLLLATVGWVRAVGRWRGAGPLAVAAALGMAGLNRGALIDTPEERDQVHAAQALAPGTVVLVADWTWRTAIVVVNPQLDVVPWGSGPRCESLREWQSGGPALWAPEQRREVDRGGPVVAWGEAARACVSAEGLVLRPAQAGPWARVELAP